MTGLHLSQYRIDDELGRGGMGIVYRATDTKLNRQVALKVLPAAALASEEDRARFFREAQAAARLNHPNIATVFQIDEAIPVDDDGNEVQASDGPRPFIAMEFVEGDTLSDYIRKGPVKLQEAVSIAGQVAEALKEAHDKEIVHRDIKSANVMLTDGGVAKVLDFGLAKTNQSTMLTRMGSTLGTVAYMSPEQARGQEVDGRTDLYALGTMLYEMVAGKVPFAGDYEQAVMYSILNESPEPLTALRTGVPMQLEWIVNKLLSKEAEYRYQSAAGLLADLKSLDLTGSGTTRRNMSAVGTAQIPAESGATGIPKWVWGALIGVALVSGFVLGAILTSEEVNADGPMRFAIDLPHAIGGFRPSWSPDGRDLYYIARVSVDDATHVRRYSLASGESVEVPGTEGADGSHVSADGRWLVFRDVARNMYRRALLSGGAPSDIAGANSPGEFGRYGTDGRFYFANPSWEIASVGEQGDVIVHTQQDDVLTYAGIPLQGPAGETVFFSDWRSTVLSLGTYRLVDRPPGFEQVSAQYTLLQLLKNGYAMVIPAGPTSQPVAVAAIDPDTGRLLGPAIPVARMDIWGFAVSPNGHLVYREPSFGDSGALEPLFRIRPDTIPDRIGDPPESPDDFVAARGRNAIVIEASPDNPDGDDLYVMDLDSGVSTRITRGADNQFAEWSPDDQHIYYRTQPESASSLVIMRRRADASAPAELVLSDSVSVSHPTLTSDGSEMLFTRRAGADLDVYRIPLGDEYPLDMADARVITDTDAEENQPDLSPDDRYVVFSSDDAVVVTTLGGEGEVVLTSDGSEPVWSPDGRWIYFERSNGTEVYRVEVTTEPVFAVLGGEEQVYHTLTHLHFGIHADGTLLVTTDEGLGEGNAERVWIVLNFAQEVERLAPRDP